MDGIIKLFECNPQCDCKVRFQRGKVIFKSCRKIFDGYIIYDVIKFVNALHKKYGNQRVPIVFEFGKIDITDKLVYIIFECICYSLMKDYGHEVEVYFLPQSDILTEGILSSPLQLLNNQKRDKHKAYMHKFRMEIYRNHFRRVIEGQNKQNTNYAGNLMQEVRSFLKTFDIIDEYRNPIASVITELVGNAGEHAFSNCLLDIDVTSDYMKSKDGRKEQGSFYGINIAILNFSDILLHEGIFQKLQTGNLGSDRYQDLSRAYNFHKEQFSKEYGYEDFCNIAALQDKISGREDYDESGGTGLTKLIKTLQSKSDMDNCYVLSGKRCVIFKQEFLEYDKEEWLGFNLESDFFGCIPDKKVLSECPIMFPGTAYNLNFIMKREES